MYSTMSSLAATGLALAVWGPLAAFAFIVLGVALWRAAGTFRSKEVI